MKHRTMGTLVLVIALLTTLLVACAPAATPAPTAAPAQSKAAEPTKPAAAAAAPTKAAEPTALPAKKVDFPAKGKSIDFIVPWPPGGNVDLGARLLGTILEKDLGVTVNMINKAGSTSQLGLTDIAQAKPDGYTIGVLTLPTGIITYLDAARKAVYTRKNFQPLALQTADPGVIVVKADGPYKGVKDLVDAAKANPKKVKVSTNGRMSVTHFALLQLEKAAGVEFAVTHFDGSQPGLTAVLGGHVDAHFDNAGPSVVNMVKSNQCAVIGVQDTQENIYLPGSKTLEAQGYKVYSTSSRGVVAPAGVPKEIVDILASSIKKAVASQEHKDKLASLTLSERYMDPAQFETYWTDMETEVKSLMELAEK